MITQCSMRHLYAASSEPGVSYLIDKAKTYERRRCGHLPSEYPEPLSTQTCLTSVVDPKDNKNNKHRYVVASQDLETRKAMRGILGVPLVYINRSVMIMEPMADASVESREREERGKFREGLKRGSGSLKREREEDIGEVGREKKKSKSVRGVKGPNPLAVKKGKKKVEGEGAVRVARKEGKKVIEGEKTGDSVEDVDGEGGETGAKRKRRRKHKSGVAAGETEAGEVQVNDSE